jgi:hypothetical protein
MTSRPSPRSAAAIAPFVALALLAACKTTPRASSARAATPATPTPRTEPWSSDAPITSRPLVSLASPPSPPAPPRSPTVTAAPPVIAAAAAPLLVAPSVPGELTPALTAMPLPGSPTRAAPATVPAPTVPAVTAPAVTARAAPAFAAAPPTIVAAAPAWPTTIGAFIARLRSDAASGRDPALAGHVDLLDVAGRLAADATEEMAISRAPELEAAEVARFGRGLGWATITSYVEAGGDAAAIREAYLDFDRVGEYTGKAGTRRIERRGDVVVGFTDGVRSALGMQFGAKWRFEAHTLDRGPARISASHQAEDPATWKMLSSRSLMIAFQEPGGVRVIEVAASVLDFSVPPILRSIAIQTALREMTARAQGIRGHWREYVGRAR